VSLVEKLSVAILQHQLLGMIVVLYYFPYYQDFLKKKD
jgi:hypothetical protein